MIQKLEIAMGAFQNAMGGRARSYPRDSCMERLVIALHMSCMAMDDVDDSDDEDFDISGLLALCFEGPYALKCCCP